MADQDTLDQFVAKASADGFTKEERDGIGKLSRKLKDVNLSLAYARMAVAHVKPMMKMVANWDQQLPGSLEANNGRPRQFAFVTPPKSHEDYMKRVELLQVKETEADRCVYKELRGKALPSYIVERGIEDLDDLTDVARFTEQYSCGNCGEWVAVVFMYLYRLGVRPLDYLKAKEPVDHGLVAIGRDGRDANDEMGTNWGKAAVICDPWASGLLRFDADSYPGSVSISRYGDAYTAYPADQLATKMKAMFRVFNGVTLTVTAR